MTGDSSLARRSYAALIACAAISLATPASAQELDTQNFHPAAGPHSIFSVQSADTVGHLQPTGGLYLNYASRPLVEVFADGSEEAVVDQQLALHVLGGFGISDRFQLDLDLPFYALNEGALGDNTFDGTALGDLWIRPKGTILSSENAPLGLGAMVDITLPIGDENAFVGAPSVTVTPTLLLDKRIGPVLLAANAGVRFVEDRSVRNLDLNEALTYGLGAEVELLQGLLVVGGELFGRSSFGDFLNRDETPLEGILGAKLVTTSGLAVSAGGGGGLVPGYGAPEFRAFLGVSWAQRTRDSDQDGILDAQDACPTNPEDHDDFEDQDGCPELDNDADGLADTEDQCPNEPEDADGFEDEDGCPDVDNDGDGLSDTEDQCPNEPEDADGFKDEDGCPDPDNDQDGILDPDDQCPDEAEDVDEFQDEDGCPDPDNDQDGILDPDDQCPNEPGLEENDGCPPKEQKAVLEKEEIRILDKVYFETDRAVIKQESFDVLDQVALILRSNPQIKKLEIGGHTDHRGADTYNQQLSEARANAVRQYLLDKGISADRLTAVGYGESKPLDAARTEQAMARNRRVEFRILERERTEQTGQSAPGDEPEQTDAPEGAEDAEDAEDAENTEDTEN